MTAAFYAYLWALVAGEIKSYAMSAHNWDAPVSFGEVSHYVGAYSDPLDHGTTSYAGVPESVSNRGLSAYPDVRYPNLVFHFANYYGITMPAPASFVYHQYYGQDLDGSCANFIAYQQAAVKGIGTYGDAAWRFNGSRSGTAYYLASYVNKYALGEWGYDNSTTSSSVTPYNTSPKDHGAAFMKTVWQNSNFQSLGDVLSAVYWYDDYDGSHPWYNAYTSDACTTRSAIGNALIDPST